MSDDETTAESVDEILEDEDATIDDELFDGDVPADDEDEIFVEDGDALDDDALDEDASEDDEDDEATVPLDVSEDGDDEFDGQPAVDLTVIEGLEVDDPAELAEAEAEDEDDTIREGEFVCSSCHMAKRSSALADADEMLCRDCV